MTSDSDDSSTVEAELKRKRKQLQLGARRLQGAGHEPDFAELKRVAQWCEDRSIEADGYGEGDELQAFEQRVADLLGYPAARFMPSGTMAQQIAMRIWTDGASSPIIGLHPTSHLLSHEEDGYDRLHGLSAVLIGDANRPMTAGDLQNSVEPMSAIIVELPTRENGGQLTEWSDLVALSAAAHERGIALHLDGARLWEAAAGYDRALDEICELFDTTYVSFYKGVGALPGAILAGPTDFVAEAAIWQNRQGGNLYTQMANWASADMRLDAQLTKMPAYRDRAVEIAAALSSLDGIILNPPVPQVNMFHVFLRGEEEALLERRDRVTETHNLWLFGGLAATDVPGIWKFELTVGDAAIDLDLNEIVAAFESFVAS